MTLIQNAVLSSKKCTGSNLLKHVHLIVFHFLLQILESYEMGLSALKATFKNAGLTEDSVSATLNHVQEVKHIILF